jgi:glycosyltransferase involved in cell wall biosynthesis
MNVLMVSKACVTRTYREKLRYMANLPDGVRLTLVVPPAWGDLPYEPPDAPEPFDTVIQPIALNGRNHWHWYRGGLGSVMESIRPDLVHIDEEHYSFVTYQVLREATARGIPALFFTWQNLFKRYPWPFRAIEQYVFSHTLGAIAGNQEALQVLRRKGYTRSVAVIPQFGTDPSTFQPAPSALRQQLGLDPEALVVGYVGRLIPEKGLDTLLDAMLPLMARDPRRRLLFAGSGPWQETASARIQAAGMADRVVFVPWMPSARMPELMNALDILVLPSLTTPRWKEQFGRVLTEAMACEVPVVGSSSGEIPHVVGTAGKVFPEGDVDALRFILDELLTDASTRRDLGQRGRERVLAHYTQEAVARSTLGFYRELLTRAPGS